MAQTTTRSRETTALAPTPGPRTLAVWLTGTACLAVLLLLCSGAALVPLLEPLSQRHDLVSTALTELAATSPLRAPTSPTSAAVLMLAGIAGTVASLRLWWILSTTCACAARGQAPRHDSRARRLVLAACGVALTVGAVAPAHASDLSSLDGLPLPERTTSAQSVAAPPSTPTPAPSSVPTARPAPAAHTATTAPAPTPNHSPEPVPRATPPSAPRAAPAPAPATSTVTSGTRTHVVAPGENLWEIARKGQSTPPDTPTTAALVTALHTTNADVIGVDPDLLLPGQVLRLPESHPAPSATPDVEADSTAQTAPETPSRTTSQSTATEKTR